MLDDDGPGTETRIYFPPRCFCSSAARTMDMNVCFDRMAFLSMTELTFLHPLSSNAGTYL